MGQLRCDPFLSWKLCVQPRILHPGSCWLKRFICIAAVGPQSPLSLPSLIQAEGVKVRLNVAGYNLALSSSSADAWPDLQVEVPEGLCACVNTLS